MDFDGMNDGSHAAAHHHETDPYLGGRFVFNNDATSFAQLANPIGWNTIFLGSGDLAFRAVFRGVPEASSAAIFAMISLCVFAVSRRVLSAL
jgi:hypothetical protein